VQIYTIAMKKVTNYSRLLHHNGKVSSSTKELVVKQCGEKTARTSVTIYTTKEKQKKREK